MRNQLQPTASCRPWRTNARIGILAVLTLIQWPSNAPLHANTKPTNDTKAVVTSQPQTDKTQPILPKNVEDMKGMLRSAVESTRIEELLTAYEWNELPPVISDERVDDPVAYWKKHSRDGQGLEILSIIDKLLQLPPAKLNIGPDHENSVLYVWPYLAELDLSKMTPRQQFEFRTLVPPVEARKILDSKKWTWWRLAIGADGTWHSFMKHDR